MIAEHFPHKAKDIPYESLFQAANDIMLLADANNTIVEANECAVNTYGWPRQELLGRPIDSLRSPRGRFDFPVDMENLRLRGQQFFETEHQTADGRRFPVEVSASLNDDTRGGLLLKIVRDISERKAFEAQIHELAYFDPVTRLANRQLFVDRLTQAIALSRRDGLPLTLLLIGFPDLRRYAFLEEGAKNLSKEAAKRLLDSIRAEDSVGRISDGEFALLLHADARGAERVATQILARFADPFPFGDKEVIVECDIGIACYPDDGRSSEDLLSAALVALLPALSEKGSTYNFHTPCLGRSAHRRLEIETHLRRALTQGELFLHYQPQIDVVTGRMVSVEALMRWQHPVWGWVSPAEFIPVADVLPKFIVHRLLAPVLKLPEAIRLICHEDRLDRLLADLALHSLDMVIADRPMPPGTEIKGYSHPLGESGIAFMASPALAEKIGSRFPANLHGAPMLLPGKDSALHLALPRWLERMNVRPRIVGEFSDSALMKAFGEAGAGIFPTPALSVAAVCEHYKVDMVGETNDIKERFFLISAERKLAHPVARAVSEHAKKMMF